MLLTVETSYSQINHENNLILSFLEAKLKAGEGRNDMYEGRRENYTQARIVVHVSKVGKYTRG